jgi:hypothetical protein
MDKEVVQIGFPKVDALLENQNISIVAQQDTFISFNTIKPIELVDFKRWKNALTSMPIGAKTTTTTTNIQQERHLQALYCFIMVFLWKLYLNY